MNPKPASPHKILNIQALRGVAVLLIVLFHILSVEKKYGGSQTILPDFFQFGMFGVDLFFVISGFVMVTVTKGKFQQPGQAFTFLYHRFSRIYPLYWFYSLLVLAIFVFQPALVNSSQGNQANLPASFLLLPQQHLPLLMVGWTLVHEIYFYLVFFLLLFLPRKFFPAGLALWAVGLLLLHGQITPDSPAGLQLISHPLTLEFIGGCLLAILTGKSRSSLSAAMSLATALITLVAAVVNFMFLWQATGRIEPPGLERVLFLGLPALLMVYFLVRAEQQQLILPKPLCRIGDISYSIYLSHLLTLNFIGRIWAEFADNSRVDNWLVLPVMLAAVILVGAVSYTRIERPMISWTRKIA